MLHVAISTLLEQIQSSDRTKNISKELPLFGIEIQTKGLQ